MEEKNNPHPPAWKMWILAIIMFQLFAAIQSYRVYQQMWEEIYRSQSVLNQVLQNEVEYRQNVNQAFELIIKKP